MYLCCYSEQAVEQTLDWPVIRNTMTVIDVAVTPPPELGISGPVVAYLWWYARHYSVLFADGRTRMMDISSSVAEEKVDRNAQGVILSRVRILPFEHALNFWVIYSRINGIFSAKNLQIGSQIQSHLQMLIKRVLPSELVVNLVASRGNMYTRPGNWSIESLRSRL